MTLKKKKKIIAKGRGSENYKVPFQTGLFLIYQQKLKFSILDKFGSPANIKLQINRK